MLTCIRNNGHKFANTHSANSRRITTNLNQRTSVFHLRRNINVVQITLSQYRGDITSIIQHRQMFCGFAVLCSNVGRKQTGSKQQHPYGAPHTDFGHVQHDVGG